MHKSYAERFWSKVNKSGPAPALRPDLGPCWLWTGAIGTDGYGQFSLDGHLRGAHRVAYEMRHGPIPLGLEPDHLCRVRSCVNDAHLEPVTHAENLRRGAGAKKQLAKTHCPAGHPYADDNLYVVKRAGRSDARGCRACNAAAVRRYVEKRKAA